MGAMLSGAKPGVKGAFDPYERDSGQPLLGYGMLTGLYATLGWGLLAVVQP
jgi:hypothetical protein